MIIAIDHGNRLMKGANFEPFISGLMESAVKPFGANVLKYKGKYYQLSDQRIPYRRDKMGVKTEPCKCVWPKKKVARIKMQP